MRLLTTISLIVSAAPALSAQDKNAAPRLNQIQVIGSHNSYKLPIDPDLLALLKQDDRERFEALEYSHIPLAAQLDAGLRNLELDVYHDPAGGRYAEPDGLKLMRKLGLKPGPAYDPDGLMRRPGLKVLHVQDIDFRTHVYTFRQALEQLKAWSDAHPEHLPIAVTMNAKDEEIESGKIQFTVPLPFDKAAFDAWEREIRAVLPPEKLITPDDVRGRHRTLEAAALARDWPAIEASRGRFLFVLDESGPKLETYVDGHPSLRGRVMFVNADEGRPEAAFRIVNDPQKDFEYIRRLVGLGYLVRTRADADTREARRNDYDRMKAAFASGAQFVTTDYYRPDPALGAGYVVRLPGGGASRWNPLVGPSPGLPAELEQQSLAGPGR